MKWISLTVFMILFSGFAFATPHYVSVYNVGKVSLLPPKEVVVDYSLRNKYDVLYHISQGYEPVDNCGVRFLKSGFANTDMEYYGKKCLGFEHDYKANFMFNTDLMYEQNELDVFE